MPLGFQYAPVRDVPTIRFGMTDPISIQGPVEVVDGKLMLRIPLDAGGEQLAPLARDIGSVVGDYLEVIIQPWLAATMRIVPGSLVCVDNKNGKFTITRGAATDDSDDDATDLDFGEPS